MDNFGKRPLGGGPRPEVERHASRPVVNSGTSEMPATRPSVIKVPPQSEQLKTKRLFGGVRRNKEREVTERQDVPNEALDQLNLEINEVRYPKRHNNVKRAVIAAIVAISALLVGLIAWTALQLTPVDSSNKDLVAVTIPLGSTPDAIADTLQQEKLIRSKLVFLVTARIQGTQNKLQAGTYRISPSESLFSVLGHLVKGSTDTFQVTFLPGATVKQNKEVLMKAGYDKREVDDAFDATYDSPLFEGRPKGADLEGYIYGDTYKFNMGLPAKKVLEKVFNEFYGVINERRLDNAYKKKGLTLYEGITLASIIQRESGGGDEAQIAQVFYTRLAMKMPLGSDVTYQYIADKTGVPRDVNLDSPYNTRRYAGLPPGPIASPGLAALRAVALPAEGDYVYFLSGDDDVTYFAKTLQEHEANIKNHCQKKCQII